MQRGVAYCAPFAVVTGILVGDASGPGPAVEVLVVGFALAGASVLARSGVARAVLLVVALALLGCALERRAVDGLTSGEIVAAADARADATVVASVTDDPDGFRWSTRMLVSVDRARVRMPDGRALDVREHRTVLVVAEGDAAGRVAVLGAGDRVVLRGWLRPLEDYDQRLRWRHAVARLDALELLDATESESPLATVANGARAITLRGTDVLEPTERALVAGFLLGDTRDLPDPIVERFRDAGLSHLLAVSGANVAFVLALIGPLLRRTGRGTRLVATFATLLVFGAMTRWEPSVLRACAMAATAVLAAHLGRPAQGVRVLALAAALLLLVDPFLVRSVGFLLSCGASLGIALLAGPIARRLRGPAWLRESLGTTVAAQVGVAPVLLPVFGSVPLVSLPANLLAVPLAGPLTTWGLTGGVIAGVVRSRAPALAELLQVPTRVLSQALLGLADLTGSVPLAVDAGDVATGGAAALVGVAAVVVLRARRRMLRERALVVPPR
ncbi:MAG: ComEC/Rec2 family competence protein [Acidimicrobiia bacterium]